METGVPRQAGIGVSMHSHITGLGLDENGRARHVGGGLVGQEEAREAAGLIVELVREGRLGGKGVLIAGPPGTGKTAIAIAIARELGPDTPFVAMNASEIYSVEKKKTEVLLQAIRRSLGVRIREKRRVLEGVVEEIRYIRGKSPFSPYPTIAGVRLTLSTKTDVLERKRFPPEVAVQLYKLRVREGDVISIDTETLEVRKLGRARGRGRRLYDIDVVEEVDVPEGPVDKIKEVVRTFTFHDIDLSIAAQRAVLGFFAIFGGEKEISDEVRQKTDEIVRKMIEEGRAEIVPGVLFIDDAHLLDLEAFGFLTKAMESEFAPLIILATNRGITRIRGTDIKSPHGMPRDLLDRLLIIMTRPYTRDEIRDIIMIRSDDLEIPLSTEALEKLADIGAERSLRYALQLLEPSYLIARRRGKRRVEPEDIEEASRLFHDVKESARELEKYGDLMLP